MVRQIGETVYRQCLIATGTGCGDRIMYNSRTIRATDIQVHEKTETFKQYHRIEQKGAA